MRSPYKILAVTLGISALLHLLLLIGIHLPDMTARPIEFKPVEVVIDEPAPAPAPTPADPKTPPPALAADKAQKDHDASLNKKDRVKDKVLVAKNNPSGKDSKDTVTFGGLGMDSQIGNKGPKALTEKEKQALSDRDNNANNNPTGGGSQTGTPQDQKNNSDSEPTDKPQSGNKDKPETSVAKGPITQKEIKDAGGRIQPRDGQTVSFPKHSADIHYKGLVPGSMSFRRNGNNNYTITATVNIPFKKMVFVSKGSIVGNTFKPTSYTDTRKGKLYASAQFDYDKKTITYGKAGEDEKEVAMEGNPLDIFSTAWQLALNQGKINGPMQVTTGKGDIKTYSAGSISSQFMDYEQGEGKIRARKLTIPARKKTYYGLATDFGYFPAAIAFDGYELYVDRFTLDGVDYWKGINKGTSKGQ